MGDKDLTKEQVEIHRVKGGLAINTATGERICFIQKINGRTEKQTLEIAKKIKEGWNK